MGFNIAMPVKTWFSNVRFMGNRLSHGLSQCHCPKDSQFADLLIEESEELLPIPRLLRTVNISTDYHSISGGGV